MTNDQTKEWHRDVLPDATETALGLLQDLDVLDRFYLAGGTGLALRLGHRLSRDLDFFSTDLFDERSLLQRYCQNLWLLPSWTGTPHAPYRNPRNEGELPRIRLPRTVSFGSVPRGCGCRSA